MFDAKKGDDFISAPRIESDKSESISIAGSTAAGVSSSALDVSPFVPPFDVSLAEERY